MASPSSAREPPYRRLRRRSALQLWRGGRERACVTHLVHRSLTAAGSLEGNGRRRAGRRARQRSAPAVPGPLQLERPQQVRSRRYTSHLGEAGRLRSSWAALRRRARGCGRTRRAGGSRGTPATSAGRERRPSRRSAAIRRDKDAQGLCQRQALLLGVEVVEHQRAGDRRQSSDRRTAALRRSPAPSRSRSAREPWRGLSRAPPDRDPGRSLRSRDPPAAGDRERSRAGAEIQHPLWLAVERACGRAAASETCARASWRS